MLISVYLDRTNSGLSFFYFCARGALTFTRTLLQTPLSTSYNWFYKTTSGPYYKSNLRWSRTRVIFFQLIASLSVILIQLMLTKLKLEILTSDFQCKKERYEYR